MRVARARGRISSTSIVSRHRLLVAKVAVRSKVMRNELVEHQPSIVLPSILVAAEWRDSSCWSHTCAESVAFALMKLLVIRSNLIARFDRIGHLHRLSVVPWTPRRT